MIGFIISLNPIFYIVASLTMGERLQKFGRKCAFSLGMILIVCQLTILGTLGLVRSEAFFVICAIIA